MAVAGPRPLVKIGGALAMAAGALLACLALLLPGKALAQSFPALSGRVVDAANIIPDDQEALLVQKLAALETQSRHQLVVATIPDLQGYDIADFGYQLGRNWGIGSKEKNDGALLIVAPNERKVRIEVGYGLEGILTDGLSSQIIRKQIVPKFKAGDMPGGIMAGTDAIIAQLQLPPDEARKVAEQSRPTIQVTEQGWDMAVFLLIFLFAFILPLIARIIRRRRRPRHHSGLGDVILWSVIDGLANSRTNSGSWSSDSDSFSGGGGSFGGGGASGDW